MAGARLEQPRAQRWRLRDPRVPSEAASFRLIRVNSCLVRSRGGWRRRWAEPKHRRVVAFESRAETSASPQGPQPFREMAGHRAASDLSTDDVLATPRHGSMSLSANWSSARCSLRARQALTHRCGLSLVRSNDLPNPQPSEIASADAHGRRVLSASLMRLRMAVGAVAALLSTCSEAHAGQKAPQGVDGAVQPKPPTPEDTHGQIHRHGRACNELHGLHRRPLGPPTEERCGRDQRSSADRVLASDPAPAAPLLRRGERRVRGCTRFCLPTSTSWWSWGSRRVAERRATPRTRWVWRKPYASEPSIRRCSKRPRWRWLDPRLDEWVARYLGRSSRQSELQKLAAQVAPGARARPSKSSCSKTIGAGQDFHKLTHSPKDAVLRGVPEPRWTMAKRASPNYAPHQRAHRGSSR
jgi:hypothetical protein